MPRYRFTGVEPEDFPAPPIARRLELGEEIEVAEPVEHARLELLGDVDAGATDDAGADETPEPPSKTAAGARPASRAKE